MPRSLLIHLYCRDNKAPAVDAENPPCFNLSISRQRLSEAANLSCRAFARRADVSRRAKPGRHDIHKCQNCRLHDHKSFTSAFAAGLQFRQGQAALVLILAAAVAVAGFTFLIRFKKEDLDEALFGIESHRQIGGVE
jgi:hypothetical protein